MIARKTLVNETDTPVQPVAVENQLAMIEQN